MKIIYYQGRHPNFGDDLNLWLWPRLIPDFFDEAEDAVFIGIGSIIGGRKFKPHVRKIVFGAGFVPQYHKKPDLSENWHFYFVRGPRTASMLGLSPEIGIGDSGILVRTLLNATAGSQARQVAFIPHWESLGRGNWDKVCALAGIHLIDPRWSVDRVLDDIKKSHLIIAEAMHGAIIADALRIPWIPLMPINKKHREKWFDWADSLTIKLEQHKLWPSSLTEAYFPTLRIPMLRSSFTHLSTKMIYLAAENLTRTAKASPMLSADKTLDHATEKMLENLEQLKKTYQKKPFR